MDFWKTYWAVMAALTTMTIITIVGGLVLANIEAEMQMQK
jgi:flagellar biosynthesis protein FliQ